MFPRGAYVRFQESMGQSCLSSSHQLSVSYVFVIFGMLFFRKFRSSSSSLLSCVICFTLQSVVRTSDVRVSNRVNKASVTLKKYPTVYNDLTGEVRDHNWPFFPFVLRPFQKLRSNVHAFHRDSVGPCCSSRKVWRCWLTTLQVNKRTNNTNNRP